MLKLGRLLGQLGVFLTFAPMKQSVGFVSPPISEDMLLSAHVNVSAHCTLIMHARAGKSLDMDATSAVVISRSAR